MIGDSSRRPGFDDRVGSAGHRRRSPIARVRMFPLLGAAQRGAHLGGAARHDARTAFRSTTSRRRCPGAFVATCHSGVTLAANHALGAGAA